MPAGYALGVARRLPLPPDPKLRAAVARDVVRGDAVEVRVDGRSIRGFAGESLAVALSASGEQVLSRSLKYHRPRSFFCLDGHCGGCLMRIDGVPNQRACMTPARDGGVAASQNAYPSANVDVLEAVDWMFAGGLNHHTLMTGSALLNRVANKVVRQLSGLGTLPEQASDSDQIVAIPPAELDDFEVCVIGGGPAGLAAATAVARQGHSVLLVDEQPRLGGSLRYTPSLSGPTSLALVATLIDDAAAAGVVTLSAATAIGYYPDELSGVLVVATHTGLRLVNAKRHIYATGGYAQNLLFGHNDRPGVMAARAVGRLLVDHGVVVADKIVVLGADAYATQLADALTSVGVDVARVNQHDLVAVRARGRQWVRGLEVETSTGKRQTLECDLIAVSALPSPAIEGLRQHGARVELRPDRGGHVAVVDERGATSSDGVFAAGDVCGYLGPPAAEAMGRRVGEAVVESLRTQAAPRPARSEAPR